MCDISCNTCSGGAYYQCTSCSSSAVYIQFSSICRCPNDYQFSSGEFDSIQKNLYDFVGALEIAFLTLIAISFMAKRSLPLTRKLLDMAQTVGLFYYLQNSYSSLAEQSLRILYYSNFSTLVPNYFAFGVYGVTYQTNDAQQQSITYVKVDNQIPAPKFVENFKSANFIVNGMQLVQIFVIGLLLQCLVSSVQVLLRSSNKTVSEQIMTNLANYCFIIVYLTFQEGALFVALQLKQISFSSVLDVCGLIAAIIYLMVIILFVLRRVILILNSQESYYENRELYAFLYDFEDPVDTSKNAQSSANPNSSINQNQQVKIVHEKAVQAAIKEPDISLEFKRNPMKILASNWILLAFVQKLITAFLIVFLNSSSPQIGILVCNIVFFKLFFFMRPIKNRVILCFCFFADVYVNVILLLCGISYAVLLFWSAIVALNVFMLLEDVLSQYFYENNSQTPDQLPGQSQSPRRKIFPVVVAAPDLEESYGEQQLVALQSSEVHAINPQKMEPQAEAAQIDQGVSQQALQQGTSHTQHEQGTGSQRALSEKPGSAAERKPTAQPLQQIQIQPKEVEENQKSSSQISKNLSHKKSQRSNYDIDGGTLLSRWVRQKNEVTRTAEDGDQKTIDKNGQEQELQQQDYQQNFKKEDTSIAPIQNTVDIQFTPKAQLQKSQMRYQKTPVPSLNLPNSGSGVKRRKKIDPEQLNQHNAKQLNLWQNQ